MKSVTIRTACIGLLWACAAAGHAGLINISGGSPISTTGNNDILGAGVTGTIGGSLSLSAPASLTYTFLGKEAAWNNGFEASGDVLSGAFSNSGSAPGDAFTVRQSAAGLLAFAFHTPRRGSVSNGTNGLSAPHFFLQRLGSGAAIVALDDGGAGPDADYDDLVVRVDAVAVPEPSTVAMALAGLLCLGVIRRRGTARAGGPGSS